MYKKANPITFRKNAFLPNTNLYVANPKPPKVLPFHKHEFGEIVFILNGSVVHVTREGESTLTRGDIFVIEGDEAHAFRKLDNLQVFYILFDMDYFNSIRREFDGLKGFNIVFGLDPQLRKNFNFKSILKINDEELEELNLLLKFYEKECRYNLPWKTQSVESYFKNIVIQLCRYYSKSKLAKNDVLVKMEKVINYMKRNFAKNITLDNLANAAKMNLSTFRNTFKQITGYSSVAFLQQLRIAEASRILLNEKVKVKHAGRKVGYHNQTYFIKIFKQAIGITPQEYIDSVRKPADKKKK